MLIKTSIPPSRAVLLASLAIAMLLAGVAHGDDSDRAGKAEAPFLAENDVAMATMMNGMAVKPSGDVDVDFVAMMIPHHQGAIDMAEAELRHGRNEQLRRIAQGIVVEQLQEIAVMRVALGESARPPTQPSTEPPLCHGSGGSSMSPTPMQKKAVQSP